MILAIATLRNLEVHQMDVKMAFLYGYLEEDVERPAEDTLPTRECMFV